MRTAWRRALIAALVVVVVAEIAARFVEPELLTDALTLEPEVEQKQQLLAAGRTDEQRVVVVGSSDMDAGAREDPFLAESTAFESLTNASLLGLSPRTLRSWIPLVLDEDDRPDLLVVGVGLLAPTADGRDGVRPVRDAAFETVLAAGSADPGARAERATDGVALVRNRASLREPELLGQAAWRRVQGEEDRRFERIRDIDWEASIDDDGSVDFYRDTTYLGGRPPELVEALADIAQPGGIYREDLRLLFEQLADLDVRTLVVVPPLPIDLLVGAGARADSLDLLRDELHGLAADAGVRLADFSTAGYTNDLFADFVHLNDAGSRRFSADLARTVDTL